MINPEDTSRSSIMTLNPIPPSHPPTAAIPTPLASSSSPRHEHQQQQSSSLLANSPIPLSPFPLKPGPQPSCHASTRGQKRNQHISAPSRPQSHEGLPACPTPQPKKVKVGARASIACETCRRRKVRCSGEYPICSFCATRSMKCEYDGHPDVSKPLNRNSVRTDGPSSSAAIPQGHLSIPPTDLPPSSLSNDSLSLPSRSVIHDVVNAFFVHFVEEGHFAFFHLPTLTRQIELDFLEPEVLLAILCVAGRFCDSLKALHGGDFRQTCNYYAAQALKLVRASPEEISVTRIQVLLMLGFHDCTENVEKRGWMHIGTAIRMSQLLKLGHLDDDDCPQSPSRLGNEDSGESAPIHSCPARPARRPQPAAPYDQLVIEHDIKRRTFWACFLIERLISDGKERPVMIHLDEDDIETRFPNTDNEFIIGRHMPTSKFSTKSAAPWGPISKNSSHGAHPHTSVPSGASESPDEEADLFGQTMRVAELWNQVVKYVANGGRNKDRRCPWLPDSTFSRLDERLSEWDMALPTHLQYSEANLVAHSMIGQGKSYGLMHLLYFTSLLYLHRDYIPFLPPSNYHPKDGPIDGEPLWHPNGNVIPPNPEWWRTSAETCFRSANAVTDLFTNLDHRGAHLTNPFAGFSILTAGTMHIHLWFWPRSTIETKNAGEYLALDTRILNNLKQNWTISNQWCQALNTQYALNSLIQDGSRSSTVLTPPLSVVRAALMKIINTQANESPSDGMPSSPQTTANQSPAANSAESVKVAAPQVSGPLPKRLDYTHTNVAEIVRQKHNIFAQEWPEPRLLDDHAHSLIGVNHRRQQQEQQQQSSSGSSEGSAFQISTAGDAASHFVHHDEHSAQTHPLPVTSQPLTNPSYGIEDDLTFDLSTMNDWNAINLLSSWGNNSHSNFNGASIDWVN